jgi:hypothetical protein
LPQNNRSFSQWVATIIEFWTVATTSIFQWSKRT